MQNLTDTLTTLISEITQMEQDNKKLNEDIRELEIEKKEGYKKFDTDTHILVERKFLEDIADEVSSSADSARENAESAESYVSDAGYSARDARDSANDIENDIKQILKVEEEEETE